MRGTDSRRLTAESLCYRPAFVEGLCRRLVRLELAVALFGVLAAVAVSAASADFKVDEGPCPEPPGGGAVLRCPTAHVGQPYTLQLEGEDGCAPYNWFEILNGSLPGGLTMTRSGLISGTPTGAGIGDFWVGEHDLTAAEGGPAWCNFDDQSQKEFMIPVDPGLAVVTDSLAAGTVGRQYSVTFAAARVETLTPPSGPAAEATWSVQSGALPPGLTLSTAGVLSGAPSAEGSWQFVVAAQSNGQTATKTVTVVVRQPVAVKSSPTPGRSEVGIHFSTTPTATGGTGTYTWSIGSGSLPAGLELNASNGAISGSPQAPGRFTFALTATDGEGRVAAASSTLVVAPRLAVKRRALKKATVGRAYAAKLGTAGGVPPTRWKVLRGKLPAGVRLTAKSGALVGKPRRKGTYRVTLEVRDALGATSQKTLVLVVEPA